MSTNPDLLTPAEAAVVAHVSVRDVHRMIDEHILPKAFYSLTAGRRVRPAACAFMSFYVHEATRLTKDERSLLIDRMCDRMGNRRDWSIRRCRRDTKPDEWKVEDGNITISLWNFVTGADDRHSKLEEARAIVMEDAEILNGTPVIRGTRIPVHDVAASFAAGLSPARIKTAYPGLDDRMLELASLYAEATPLLGRPKQAVPLPATNSVRKVVRRHRA